MKLETKVGDFTVEFYSFNPAHERARARKAVGTVCLVHHTNGNGFRTYSGVTYFNPKDEYSDKLGRKHALTKALETLSVDVVGPKQVRQQIWEAYFKKMPGDKK